MPLSPNWKDRYGRGMLSLFSCKKSTSKKTNPRVHGMPVCFSVAVTNALAKKRMDGVWGFRLASSFQSIIWEAKSESEGRNVEIGPESEALKEPCSQWLVSLLSSITKNRFPRSVTDYRGLLSPHRCACRTSWGNSSFYISFPRWL